MECNQREIEGKRVNDPLYHLFHSQKRRQQPSNSDCPVHKPSRRRIWVSGPIIVGAGPSGLAVAACLKDKGLTSMIIERSDCIASLWKHKSYERLRLHLPKRFCELPLMPFPACFPQYPTKQQFVAYLEDYAARFHLRPTFDRTVVAAEFDGRIRSWRVATVGREKDEAIEYVSCWLVVATGENAEEVMPDIDGMHEFEGQSIHTSSYRSGHAFRGKRVLVVGCGNSGMEVCLDLCNHNARPSIVVRDAVHILPREIFGWSTFGLFMWLLKWLSVPTVDRFLLLLSRATLGDIERYGLRRPELGPLQHKSLSGKTPVLDVGTLAKLKSGDIKVRPAIKRLTPNGAEFVDGRLEEFDAVIFATGYKSNVPTWLKEKEFFSDRDGLPRKPFPNSWKGESGLYAAGFTRRGLMGSSMDAVRIAHDIEQEWKKA